MQNTTINAGPIGFPFALKRMAVTPKREEIRVVYSADLKIIKAAIKSVIEPTHKLHSSGVKYFSSFFINSPKQKAFGTHLQRPNDVY